MDPSRPLRVSSVHVTGNDRTHASFIEDELREARQARTVKDVIQSVDRALKNLESYGLFESATIVMDTGSPVIDDPSAVTTDLTVQLKERQWWGARTEVTQELHTGEQMLKLSGVVRNFFGHGERIDVSSQGGTAKSSTVAVQLTQPKLFTSPRLRGSLGFNSAYQNFTRHASFIEHSRGLTASVSDPFGQHELQYEGAWRDILPTHRTLTEDERRVKSYRGPSASVVRAAVPSVKSSLKYTYTLDRLDQRFVPTSGHYLQASGELAGLGGDVSFVKGQVDGKYFLPLHPYVSIGLGIMGGVLRPFGSFLTRPSAGSVAVLKPRSQLSDRFFLGTSLTLRGFEPWSVGPLDHEDNVGGDAMASISAALSFALPFKLFTETGARMNVFANAGNLIDTSDLAAIKQSTQSARVAVGVGMAVPTPLGRLELNLIQPVRKQDSDRTRRFQWGLGWQFT